ncbi:ribosomal RNA processing protein 36 homolog [Rhopilema esculentum]|uniref:ribosomal RNA processing protein 36 homolog n=1 Tax=Rhopilema esculentum TaxID=499914 RepID=UPI0031E438C1
MDDSFDSDMGESDVEISTDSSDQEENKEDSIRNELGDVPFEDLEVLEKKLGESRYEEVMFGVKKESNNTEKKREAKKSDQFAENRKKKDSRPLEMSSKQRPKGFRRVVKTNSAVTRDPRFDNLSGNLNIELFKKSYSFLDEIQKKEKEVVEKQLRSEKSFEKKAALHKLMQKIEQKEKIEMEENERKEQHREWKRNEKEAIKRGKRPFYLKKSERKKKELAEKFKKLKETGKIEKYLSKKRKRNAAKDRKYLPMKRKQES